MASIRVSCKGLSPLLMNRFDLDDLTVSCRRGQTLSAEETASKKIFRDVHGNIGLPADILEGCLMAAGRSVKNGGRLISTASSSMLPQFLWIKESFLPFSKPEWKIRRDVGRLGNGIKLAIVRPQFDNWAFSFILEIHERKIDEDVAKKLVEVAGNYVGLCDFRPACRGMFGRFVITEWTKLGDAAAGNGKAELSEKELAQLTS